MQTLHLWLQDLRAISLGQSPGRWPTPSAAIRDGTKGPPGLSNSPGPTSAVGLRPERQPQNPNRCPIVGAGLFLSLPFRRALICGATTPDLRRVCPRQTADVIHQAPALHKAGEIGGSHRQARASEVHRTPSLGLSFSRRTAPHKAGAGGKKTIGRGSDGPGTYRSEAIDLRPTGRGAARPTMRMVDRLHLPFCTITPPLVTGQEPGGTGVPGDALLRCARALQWRLSSARGEGGWPATTSL